MNGTTKKRVRSWVLSIGALSLAGWLCLVGYVNWAMHQPRDGRDAHARILRDPL
jgi:hypothetical protein